MRRSLVVLLGLFALWLAGCGGPRPYQPVDLDSNLGKETLRRYEREWQEVHAEGRHGAMARLEHTNWWPLGLLVYWRRGSVTRTAGSGGPVYHISSAHGYGPLSHPYVTQTDATFDGDGKRLSASTMGSVGHLAMFHISDVVLANGRRQKMTSLHLVHHLLNIHTMDGHTAVSLLSAPNPVGVDVHAAHAGHAEHAATSH